MKQPRVELFKDSQGEWWWRLKASNGQILAGSTEGYKNRVDAMRGVTGTSLALSYIALTGAAAKVVKSG